MPGWNALGQTVATLPHDLHLNTLDTDSEKEEAAVDRIATDRLVPPGELGGFIDTKLDAKAK